MENEAVLVKQTLTEKFHDIVFPVECKFCSAWKFFFFQYLEKYDQTKYF